MSEQDSAGKVLKFVKGIGAPTFKKSQDVYKEWARSYDKDLAKQGYIAPKLTCQYVCKVVPPEKRAGLRVLDVGAGTGVVARELRQAGYTHIDALEPSEAMLDMARKDNLYNNYYVEGISREPSSLAENSYDLLTGSGIYVPGAHVPSDAIYEMIRLVKPGGYITLVSRHMVLETPHYLDLQPLMDQVEAEGKWKKVRNEIVAKMFMNFDAMVWQYQVL